MATETHRVESPDGHQVSGPPSELAQLRVTIGWLKARIPATTARDPHFEALGRVVALLAERDTRQDRIQQLEQEVRILESLVSTLRRDVVEHEGQATSHARRAAALEQDAIELRQQLAAVRANLSLTNDQTRQHVTTLTHALEAAHAESEQLRRDLASATSHALLVERDLGLKLREAAQQREQLERDVRGLREQLGAVTSGKAIEVARAEVAALKDALVQAHGDLARAHDAYDAAQVRAQQDAEIRANTLRTSLAQIDVERVRQAETSAGERGRNEQEKARLVDLATVLDAQRAQLEGEVVELRKQLAAQTASHAAVMRRVASELENLKRQPLDGAAEAAVRLERIVTQEFGVDA
jgi:chromosome segregation ATPase